MHTNDFFIRYGKHAKGVMIAQIVFVGKREFRQIRQIIHIIRMHARRIKAFTVHRNIVIGMTQ